MPEIQTVCDAGCNKAFTITDMPTVRLDHTEIEQTYFICTHCGHVYTAYYTDTEIRKLQARIRRVQRRFSDSTGNHKDAKRKEADLKALIKGKMDALRVRVEAL